MHYNESGQPVGFPLDHVPTPLLPSAATIEGRLCRIEKLNAAQHSEDLFMANALDSEHRNWTYMPYGPFASMEAYQHWVLEVNSSPDPFFYAILDQGNDKAIGVASYLRIDPKNASIEVGHINFSPLLQRTAMATEAMFLLMQGAFDLGYRRYEWKCDNANASSIRAAKRLGFSFEGVFRQATHYKNRNRDTAWLAVIDSEWPALQSAFQTWLAVDNFHADGTQKQSLATLTYNALHSGMSA